MQPRSFLRYARSRGGRLKVGPPVGARRSESAGLIPNTDCTRAPVTAHASLALRTFMRRVEVTLSESAAYISRADCGNRFQGWWVPQARQAALPPSGVTAQSLHLVCLLRALALRPRPRLMSYSHAGTSCSLACMKRLRTCHGIDHPRQLALTRGKRPSSSGVEVEFLGGGRIRMRP
jgi:hypothetical protein